ncbi:MAG: class I SAM-dependent methyltransferase [Saccharospirillaceae bacterium]|nr:class I SAM-dependent methyltransferase [Saccharospirillaceae bacterium]
MARQEFHNLAEQYLNPPGRYWGNLGLWSRSTDDPVNLLSDSADMLHGEPQQYADACCALATTLAQQSKLNAQSRVLDIGFGCGDQLLFWLQHYRIESLHGFNKSHSQTKLAQQRLRKQGYDCAANQCCYGDIAELSELQWRQLGSQCIDRVMALDCIYHFSHRQSFLQRSQQLLISGGCLGFTDLVLLKPFSAMTLKQRLLLRLMLAASRIPQHNLKTLEQQQQSLQSAGFQQIRYHDLSQNVMLGFANWLTAFKSRYQSRHGRFFWFKYQVTASFLTWAWEQRLLGYGVLVAYKTD